MEITLKYFCKITLIEETKIAFFFLLTVYNIAKVSDLVMNVPFGAAPEIYL